MRFASPILVAIGLGLVGGSFFIGQTVPIRTEAEESAYEQAVTDLHGMANRGESSEEAKARIAAANEVLESADEKSAAAQARSRRLAWMMKVMGLLVMVVGAGLHFFAAHRP